MAQLGSAPAFGTPDWRWWASVSVGNAGFLRQLRRPASVGVGTVFGTVLKLTDHSLPVPGAKPAYACLEHQSTAQS